MVIKNNLLNKYYTDIYYDLDLSCEKYWDHEYHPETIDRITIEDYMNIHFYNNDDYEKLLNLLTSNNINYTPNIPNPYKTNLEGMMNAYELSKI